MALTALKGKKVKKKASNRAKSRTGIAYVPLTNFHTMCDYVHMEVSKKEIISFNKQYVKKNLNKKLLKCEDWVFYQPSVTMTVLWKSTGQEFPEKWGSERALSSFKTRLEQYASQFRSQEEPGTPNKSVRSPADIIKSKTSNFIAEAEEVIDNWEDNSKYSMFEELKKIDAPYIMAKSVRDFYLGLCEELEELVQQKSVDLVEAYSHLDIAKRKVLKSFVCGMIEECEKYMATKKASRAVRKPKVKAAIKQIDRLQYLKESKEYRVASVNPLSVVGASRLFAFNTKHKILKELISNSTDGFQISGSTIKNVDNEESRETTLRKPETMLHVVTSKSKKLINESWDKLTTKTRKTNTRINKDTILLRITD